jgi:hypothetical protein
MDDREAEKLRRLIKESEPAEIFDKTVRQRIAEAISRAVFHPRRWRG